MKVAPVSPKVTRNPFLDQPDETEEMQQLKRRILQTQNNINQIKDQIVTVTDVVNRGVLDQNAAINNGISHLQQEHEQSLKSLMQ